MSEPRRILILRYSALGDVVLATSILEPLRKRFPDATIEWVTDRNLAPLLEGLPELAAVHRLEKTTSGTLALRSQLAGRFDLAIDLQNKFRTAVIARAAAPRRLTFRRRTTGESLQALIGRDRPLVRAHATALYAEVLAPLGIESAGALRVQLSEKARSEAAAVLPQTNTPLVAIAPGARWDNKRWLPERFAEVARELSSRGYGIVLAGGPPDREVLEAVRASLEVPLVADLTSLSLPALAAALSRVSLLIANDSGPVHLATAVGTPAVAVFGPTALVRWGPPSPGRAVSLNLPCSPCSNHGAERCPLGHHRCMRDLPAAQVVQAASEVLQQLHR